VSAEQPYPVRVSGARDSTLNRWLWLVKWFLLIPHYIVLLFLWIAFFLLTIVAFFAILITGRYPRVIFEFNLGVLRWTWRVGFYSYSALATDQYPPFTLGPVPDYPATLEVDYPEHLSRGLVLVKSWLLAIPQYLIVALFIGGWGHLLGPGVAGLLVLFAAVALRFRARYPQSIFRLRDGHESLDGPRRCLCRADARRVPPVPPRHGRRRTRSRQLVTVAGSG
jgi:Domain of unknown function (DUF4389)